MTAARAANRFLAHVDGGSRGNPGPAAYGVVIRDLDGAMVAELRAFLGRRTNNFAEYCGLLAALKWAHEMGCVAFEVVSDSQLMVEQMRGRYQVRSPDLAPLRAEAARLAAALPAFTIRHVRREFNQDADRLVNQALDLALAEAREQGSAGTKD